MWLVTVVLVVLVTVALVAKGMGRPRVFQGASRSCGPPRVKGGRGSAADARMKRQSVVTVALLCAVVGMPQTTSAAGNYGAIVEKGVRGCVTDPRSGVVICFESPTVNSQSRSAFLQAWRSVHLHPVRSDAGPTTLFVRTVSVGAASTQDSRPVLTYLASADLVMPEMACTADFRFRASDGVMRLTSLVIACLP